MTGGTHTVRISSTGGGGTHSPSIKYGGGDTHSPSIKYWGDTHSPSIKYGGGHTQSMYKYQILRAHTEHHILGGGGDTLSIKYLRTHTVQVVITGGAAHLHNPTILIQIVVGTHMKSEYTRNKYWWV